MCRITLTVTLIRKKPMYFASAGASFFPNTFSSNIEYDYKKNFKLCKIILKILKSSEHIQKYQRYVYFVMSLMCLSTKNRKLDVSTRNQIKNVITDENDLVGKLI